MTTPNEADQGSLGFAIIITLVAAPLGIVFSRRGLMGGVAAAMLIFFGLLVFNNLFLALEVVVQVARANIHLMR